ncbi:MAG TPA: endonuclease/exonuclease/phosphatase family protein [Solirubrobacteraceae bacterium]|jgi:exodeoxyribonuclease-3
MRLGILTLNIANPSAARAERLLDWLSAREEQVLVLTETGTGQGTRGLLERLAGAGWDVRTTGPADGERGVAIATSLHASPRVRGLVDYLPWRAEQLTIDSLDVIGLYVPSRDDSREKVERKRRFCAEVSARLAAAPSAASVVIGDLNVLEPVHRPHYGTFRDWEYRFYDEFVVCGYIDAYRQVHPQGMEYSWVDHQGSGYRFDHVFLSAGLASRIEACDYDHAAREAELSDHSALVLRLDWPVELDQRETAKPGHGDSLALF